MKARIGLCDKQHNQQLPVCFSNVTSLQQDWTPLCVLALLIKFDSSWLWACCQGPIMLLKIDDPLPAPPPPKSQKPYLPPSKSIVAFRPAGSHMLLFLQDRQWALSRHLAMKVIPGTPFPYALCTERALSCATILAARYSQCT